MTGGGHPVILPVEAWMDLRRYKPLRDAGATWREIADEVGLDWRTVKRYLSTDTPGPPTAPSRRGCVTRKIDALAPVVDAWLASYSRDPFCCFTTSQDLGTFFDCHRRAFAHFGGVPGSIVYDRTKTVVRRHVAPREAVPLHPEAAAFAQHYGFVIGVLAAYRPTG